MQTKDPAAELDFPIQLTLETGESVVGNPVWSVSPVATGGVAVKPGTADFDVEGLLVTAFCVLTGGAIAGDYAVKVSLVTNMGRTYAETVSVCVAPHEVVA